ncbi:TraM recognition domain-containing protein [Streptomyces sp. 549]|uniref:type IV secretory system conjugative DNA transfer family protein n=1 Tax=Streptomyces sp. 549 TaxID=3049076 RepID=UPI0024C35CDC|nr:FtsK/SpoIIIE domain-containing protein [Streptomyces sp. 549]MDK1476827.1 TraM recognition domain-containing protein [Streptomyces sp. 549]
MRNQAGAVGDGPEWPRARWGGQERRTVSGWEALVRMVTGLGAVVAPLPAVVGAVVAVCARRLALRGRWLVAGAGAVAVPVVVVFGGWEAYCAPYHQLVDGLTDVDAQALLQAGPEGLLFAVAGRVPGWAAGQAPLAVAAGVLAGGLWLTWRWRFRPWWRAGAAVQLPERKLEAAIAALEKADDREPAQGLGDLRVRVGVDAATGAVCDLPGPALRQHVFVAGATGYGKSRTIERLLHELVVTDHAAPLRVPIVFIDMKADPEFATALEAMATTAGRRFHLVTVTGQGSTYNPIRNGSVVQACSRIVETLDQVAGGGFSEPHHREASEVFLRHAMCALDDLVAQQVTEQFPDGARAWRRDLPDLAKLMSVKALADRTRLLAGTTGREVHRYLDYLQSDGRELQRSVPGLAARIVNMTAGDAGRVLTDRPDGIDLHHVITSGDVVLFSLSAARDARAARQIGSLALTDLGSVGDRLLEERWGSRGGFFFAGVDEFSALGGSTMTALFQRIRGAGGGLLLATQDIADLDAVSPEFTAAVMTNTNIMLLHRQRSAAEPLAALLGTRPGWEEALQVQDDAGPLGTSTGTTGSSQLRPIHERIVEPETLRRLPPGQAVVAVGHPQDTTQTVRIALAPRLDTASPEAEVSLTKTLAVPPLPRPVSLPPALPPRPPAPPTAAMPAPPAPPQSAPVDPVPQSLAAPVVDGADMWH